MSLLNSIVTIIFLVTIGSQANSSTSQVKACDHAMTTLAENNFEVESKRTLAEKKGFVVEDDSRWTIGEAIRFNPQFMNQYGYRLERNAQGNGVIRAPGAAEINSQFENHKGDLSEKSFRFIDWVRPAGQPVKDAVDDMEYLEFLHSNIILLGTDFWMAAHDRMEGHMITYLLMPKEVFLAYREQVDLFFRIRTLYTINGIVNVALEGELREIATHLTKHWDFSTYGTGALLLKTGLKAETTWRASRAFLDVADPGVIAKILSYRESFLSHSTEDQRKKFEDILSTFRKSTLTLEQVRSVLEHQLK